MSNHQFNKSALGRNPGHYFYHGEKTGGEGPTAADVTRWDFGQKLPGRPLGNLMGASLKSIRFNGVSRGEMFDARDWGTTADKGNLEKKPFQMFDMKTVYPGLVLGTGYAHPAFRKTDEDQNAPGDFQLGFFFDWTTGLPVIPGSSVKGALRAVFPKNGESEETALAKRAYILDRLLENMGVPHPADKTAFIETLENMLFIERDREKNLPPSIFYDAYLLDGDDQGRVFAEDYITPHGGPGRDDPLKNPTPLRFLKIGPGVTFRFQFRLRHLAIGGIELSPGEQAAFFKAILKDFGIGAKRNTGYGVLV